MVLAQKSIGQPDALGVTNGIRVNFAWSLHGVSLGPSGVFPTMQKLQETKCRVRLSAKLDRATFRAHTNYL